MLAVRVDDDHLLRIHLARRLEAGAQSCAVAAVLLMADDMSTRALAISAVASELPSSGAPVDVLLASPGPSWRVVRSSLSARMAAMVSKIQPCYNNNSENSSTDNPERPMSFRRVPLSISLCMGTERVTMLPCLIMIIWLPVCLAIIQPALLNALTALTPDTRGSLTTMPQLQPSFHSACHKSFHQGHQDNLGLHLLCSRRLPRSSVPGKHNLEEMDTPRRTTHPLLRLSEP